MRPSHDCINPSNKTAFDLFMTSITAPQTCIMLQKGALSVQHPSGRRSKDHAEFWVDSRALCMNYGLVEHLPMPQTFKSMAGKNASFPFIFAEGENSRRLLHPNIIPAQRSSCTHTSTGLEMAQMFICEQMGFAHFAAMDALLVLPWRIGYVLTSKVSIFGRLSSREIGGLYHQWLEQTS